MQISLAWPTCAAALTLGLAVPAAAQDVTFAFTGILTATDNCPYPDLTPGTPFSGTYTFNLLAPDTNPHPDGGNYPHSGAPYGITVRIGDRVFQTDPDFQPYAPFVIDVIDDSDGHDLYQVLSMGNLPVEGIPVGDIFFLLEDPHPVAAFVGGAHRVVAGCRALAAAVRVRGRWPRRVLDDPRPPHGDHRRGAGHAGDSGTARPGGTAGAARTARASRVHRVRPAWPGQSARLVRWASAGPKGPPALLASRARRDRAARPARSASPDRPARAARARSLAR